MQAVAKSQKIKKSTSTKENSDLFNKIVPIVDLV